MGKKKDAGGKKVLLWQRLVESGMAADRADVERLVLLRKVYVADAPATSAGQKVPGDARLEVRGLSTVAGKGALKLFGALDAFGLRLEGRVAIDAGASTGGFTDALLQRGCARVYAVDVGYGQLTGALRVHPGVVNLERTNISDPSLLTLTPRPNLGTVDLSYLSLRKAVPAFAEILGGQGELVCLVKPLFEIDDPAARRAGVIPEDAYAPTLKALCADLAAQGFPVRQLCASPVTGNKGTLEFFLHIVLGEEQPVKAGPWLLRIQEAVDQALALERFHKDKG